MWELAHKKAEHQIIDAFKLCWRRFLRVLWTAMRSKQSILKEINPEYSLEGLMLKLKFLYFSHLMWRADSLVKTLCWERLRAGRDEGGKGWHGCMVSLAQWTWFWASSGIQWRTGKPGMQNHGIAKMTQWLNSNNPSHIKVLTPSTSEWD